MDARHQWCVSWQWWWKGNLFFLELLGSISQIQLIKHAMRPVTGQCTPILLTELLALGKKPMQIGTLCQFIAIQRLIDAITAHLIVALSHWHHIYTFTRLKTDVPVIFGHTCNHVVVGQVPAFTYIGVLNPYIRILLCQRNLRDGILHKDARMRLTVEMHDLPLVVHQILKAQRRGDHLTRGTEMIELTTSQRHDGHFQLA